MKGIDKRKAGVKGIITILLVLAGWAFFNLVKIGAENLLLRFGITSEALQMVLIIVFVAAVLLLLGFGFKKTINKIMNGK